MNDSGRIINEDAGVSVKRNMTEFAKASFIDRYPDIRDGLKPVARKIIYAMARDHGLHKTTHTIKCAQVVGTVMGSYHPHGDQATYGALISMGTPFNTNYPIVFVQGNSGNLLGDGAAGMRYTECRLTDYAKLLINDMSDDVVDFVPNYDNRTTEPTVLPSEVPNLLINGNYSIGGAAFNSSIPSHNLRDVIDLTIAVMKNPEISNKEIADKLLPDFPFGGVITNPEEIKRYYAGGETTSLKMTSKYWIDYEKHTIHITELPYLVSGNAVKDEIINKFPKLRDIGIENIYTECDEMTMDLSIVYLKTTNPEKLIELLKSKAKLSNNIQLILTCTVDGRLIENCRIKTFFTEWIKFRRDVVRKIMIRDIQKIIREMHILEALIKSYGKQNQIIKMIRSCDSRKMIIDNLMMQYGFTVLQAEAIASMRLHELSRYSENELIERYTILKKDLDERRSKLNDKIIDDIIINRLLEIKAKFGRPRRTIIRNEINKGVKIGPEPVPLVVALAPNNCVAFIRKNVLLKNPMGGKISQSLKYNKPYQLIQYNAFDDTLYAVTNLGYFYKIDNIELYLKNSTIESNKWETMQINPSPRAGEVIVGFVSINKSEFADNSFYLLLTFDNNRIKAYDSKMVIEKPAKNGAILYKNGKVLRVFKLDKRDGDMLMYTMSTGHVHKYPLEKLYISSKNTPPQKGTVVKTDYIDFFLAKNEDDVCYVRDNGVTYGVKAGCIPIKYATNIPYKIPEFIKKGRGFYSLIASKKFNKNDKYVLAFNKTGNYRLIDYCTATHGDDSAGFVMGLII